jgi:uncharacterized protein involved in response to NO
MTDGQAATRKRIPGNKWFFPAATLYAIAVVPASVAAMLGVIRNVPGLASPAGHAHEMLFGFALAVVAGNQLGPRTARVLTLLVVTWIFARVAFVLAPASSVAVATNVLFPALLGWHLAPRLMSSAKKWRNQALPAALVAICASAVALTVAVAVQRSAARSIVDVGVALFALLLLFMGGRLIAPTVAGQIYRQGGNLDARVQPRIEGVLIVVMASAIVLLALEAFSPDPAAVASGGALVVAGVLAAVRLARWRLWRLEKRPDLLCLGAGYAWLALGLVLFGLTHARLAGSITEETLAIHVITIGSLGTLTLNVMAMTRLLTLRLPVGSTSLPIVGTLLIAAATLLRVGFASHAASLFAAAVCWSLAYALLLALLLGAKRQAAWRSERRTRSQAG